MSEEDTLVIPQDLWNMILAFFEGNAKKTTLWFSTPNPGLGLISPAAMLRIGREESLRKFIEATRDGYNE